VALEARVSPRLSIVAPCYNEEEGLEEFYRRMTAAAQATAGSDYEFVLLNDGSSDRTWAIMTDLVRRDPHLVAVNLSRRHGHQLAITAGLYTCRGERILMIDADLQDPPELLADMWRLMDSAEADVIYGVRRQREGETMLKRGTATLFYRLMQRVGYADLPVDAGDFRLMTWRVLEILNSMPEQHRFIRGMVSWIGLRQLPIQYDRAARTTGASNYPIVRMVGLAFDALTSFSIMPLRLASYLGVTRPFEFADGRLHHWQLGARPCGRRLDELTDRGPHPRLDAAHSVRSARRICRQALSGNQAPAAVRHRSGADAKHLAIGQISRATRNTRRRRGRYRTASLRANGVRSEVASRKVTSARSPESIVVRSLIAGGLSTPFRDASAGVMVLFAVVHLDSLDGAA
jgi:glycosyltransferase involved in cell wall biosynthesis